MNHIPTHSLMCKAHAHTPQEYFEDHAAERLLLRHDKPLHRTPQVRGGGRQPHALLM